MTDAVLQYARKKGNIRNLTGKKFGRLLVLERDFVKTCADRSAHWRCLCDCGSIKSISSQHLIRGLTVSCGCFSKEKAKYINFKHGLYKSTEYLIWADMKDRCLNPNNIMHKHYGGRSITVDKTWISDFLKFREDMGPRPSKDHEIDRINNDGPYSKDNTRWATRREQLANRRNTFYVQYNNKKTSLAQLAAEFGIGPSTARSRFLRGWSVEKILSTPVKRIRRTKT